MPQRYALLCRFIFLALVVPLVACAEAPPPSGAAQQENPDPWENLNRRCYANNDFVDRLIVRPVAELYRALVPPGLRERLTGILSNMKEPVILVNNVLQGEFDKAGTTIERFGINTTLGVGGLWDVADTWELPQQTGDFGQTLAAWGVEPGPYVMLPVFGPSNLRDTAGLVVDLGMSPWQYIALGDNLGTFARFEVAHYGSGIIVKREKYIESHDALKESAIDDYAALRSAYWQWRNKQLGVSTAEEIPDYSEQ